jgi:hypothetical protein
MNSHEPDIREHDLHPERWSILGGSGPPPKKHGGLELHPGRHVEITSQTVAETVTGRLKAASPVLNAGKLRHKENRRRRSPASILPPHDDLERDVDKLLAALVRCGPDYCVGANLLSPWQAALLTRSQSLPRQLFLFVPDAGYQEGVGS